MGYGFYGVCKADVSFANISELTSLLPPRPNKLALICSSVLRCCGDYYYLSPSIDLLYFNESYLLVTPLFVLAFMTSSFLSLVLSSFSRSFSKQEKLSSFVLLSTTVHGVYCISRMLTN